MQVEEKSETYPGQLLVRGALNEFTAGSGVYEYLGNLYASIQGDVKIEKAGSWTNKTNTDIISVKPILNDKNERMAENAENSEDPAARQPKTGDEIYGKVIKVEDRFAKIEILAIGSEPLASSFIGILQ